MALLVLKFGGTSVADIDHIKNVAKIIKREADDGNQVVVVVSAMAGVTDQLISFTKEICKITNDQQSAEYDAVLSSGEQVTAGLLALTLQSMDIPARSWLGTQLPIKTGKIHSKAKIESIKTDLIEAALEKGEVVIIPGFQGTTEDGRVATLGRGGSDTSAVAMAAALKADRCDIYTDVDGVYTCDPRIVKKARKLSKVSYEEMLEMASLGTKVLQTRSVQLAMKYKVNVQVRSTFSDEPGTLLVDEEEIMERRVITGITYSKNDAQISLIGVENSPGIAAEIFGPLAEGEIYVDMIVQSISGGGTRTDMTFTVPKEDLDMAVKGLDGMKDKIAYQSMISDSEVAKVSVIGVGMKSHTGIAHKMFQTLADNGINILVISTSEIKISVLIEQEHLELALKTLHTAYELDAEPKEE